MTVRALGINHIAFEVHDLDETLDWYARWFAFELRGRRRTMAWLDLGDQFIALSEGGPETPDRGRHVGLVVDDKEALRAVLLAAGEPVAESGSLRMRDPSGNLLEIVDYRDVQFTKTPTVLRALGVDGLTKSGAALEELRAKGLAETDDPGA
jgi:catechol-2,3-dioxygenase